VSWLVSLKHCFKYFYCRSISDADGPKIADIFYETLFKGKDLTTNWPDPTQAAQALHLAVAKLQAQNASFVRWVPFIHLGF
jgi:hypothetical protein